MEFYLGTHLPNWLGEVDVPLFLSFTRLRRRETLGKGKWAVDSGGYTELSRHGTWTIPPNEYVQQLDYLIYQSNPPDFAAVQDWMCEPSILRLTGLTIQDHQERTIASYQELCYLAPDIAWLPIVQGQTLNDYERHVDMYAAIGVDLRNEAVVGIGSICRRQGTIEAADIIDALSAYGLRLHAFGIKTLGLLRIGYLLNSSDSMAWSFTARREKIQMQGHTHQNCANCQEYALKWRSDMLCLDTIG